jgi:hypothetical protein
MTVKKNQTNLGDRSFLELQVSHINYFKENNSIIWIKFLKNGCKIIALKLIFRIEHSNKIW